MNSARKIIFNSNHEIIDPGDPLAIIFNKTLFQKASSQPLKDSCLTIASNPLFENIKTTDFSNSHGFNQFFHSLLENDLILNGDTDLYNAILNDRSLKEDLKNNLICDLKTDGGNQFFLKPLFGKRDDLLKSHLLKISYQDIDQIFNFWHPQAIGSGLDQEKTECFLRSAAIEITVHDPVIGAEESFLVALSFIDPEPGGFAFDPHSFKEGLDLFKKNLLEKTSKEFSDQKDFSLDNLRLSYRDVLAEEIKFFIAVASSGSIFDLEKSDQELIALSIGNAGAGYVLEKLNPLIEKARSQSGKSYHDFDLLKASFSEKHLKTDDVLEIFSFLSNQISEMIVGPDEINFELIADRLNLKIKTILNSN